MVHQPVSRGLTVFADAWLSGWLAEISADLRENGSALEVVLHDYVLYKSTFTLLHLLLTTADLHTLHNTSFLYYRLFHDLLLLPISQQCPQ